jgi:D-3-phosphoglycerate dehydrogenase
MVGSEKFAAACQQYLPAGEVIESHWLGKDKTELQRERILVEKHGPDAIPIPESITRHAGRYQMLLVCYAPISSHLIDFFPDLRIIAVARAGIENLDLAAATARNILVFNVTGRNAHAVSDFAVGLILAELRNLARAHMAVINGKWRKDFLSAPHQLHGKRVGILGLGKIGALVAKKLQGFEVQLVGFDPHVDSQRFKDLGVKSLTLAELMRTSDVITVHARLSETTRHMIGKNEIQSMKPTAILVNTARAGLIDMDALCEALANHRIAGAALDVFDPEPLSPSDPLLKLENVTLTSHLAGTTVEAIDGTPYLLCENIRNFLVQKKTENIINPEVLNRISSDDWEEIFL